MHSTHVSDLAELAEAIDAGRRVGLGVIQQPAETALPVTGSYPAKPAFFFSCDGDYFKVLCLILLSSISGHSPGARCYVHLVDAPPGIEALAKPIPLEFTFTRESSGLESAEKQVRLNYYNAIRFVRIAEALEHNSGPLWIADVDALVTRDVRSLLDTKAALAMRMRPGRAALNEHASACLVLGTTASRDFFRHVSRFILSRPLFWGFDQFAHFSALIEHNPGLELLGPDIEGVEADKPGAFRFTAGGQKLTLLTDKTPYAREFRRTRDAYFYLLANSQGSRPARPQ